MKPKFEPTWQDVGNIVFLEHINLTVPDQEIATDFYVDGLGFTRDPYMMVSTSNMWVNAGKQQFHLPRGTAQHFRGRIGLVVPDLGILEGRLGRVQGRLADTEFSFARKRGWVDITCPWGNRFRAHQRYGSFDGSMGIPYVEMTIPDGTAKDVAKFYSSVMGAPATVTESRSGAAATVCSGPGHQLIYRESKQALAPYDGHHIAIYIADFSGPHAALEKRGLISQTDNPFQYRFVSIPSARGKTPVFELEHEVRSLFHPLYRRPLVNRTGDERLP